MYEDKTPEAIKAEILAAIRQSQGLSAMAGGFADGVAGPVAEQLSEAYRALEGVPSMLFVDESSGGYIDLVGGFNLYKFFFQNKILLLYFNPVFT